MIKSDRDQRLKEEETHEEYWGQFATDYLKNAVISEFGIKSLCEASKQGKYFNSIPLARWDRLGEMYKQYIDTLIRKTNKCVAPSDLVCTLKAAARQVVIENSAVDEPSESAD